jgi:hypothetical protein
MDPVTAAIRTSAVVAGAGAWLAAPTIKDRLGEGTIVKAQFAAAGIAATGAAIEFTHHGLGGYVSPRWSVGADEAITLGWERLGLGANTRTVGLCVAAAAGAALVGLGFGADRGSH